MFEAGSRRLYFCARAQMCVCMCVCVYKSGRKRNIRRLRQIIADKVAQRFFVLMAREIARLGTTAADERRV